MGDIVPPDRAISHALMIELMNDLKCDWEEDSGAKRLEIVQEGCIYVIAFILALREEEVPLIEMRGLHNH
jgi:hypothetical protein